MHGNGNGSSLKGDDRAALLELIRECRQRGKRLKHKPLKDASDVNELADIVDQLTALYEGVFVDSKIPGTGAAGIPGELLVGWVTEGILGEASRPQFELALDLLKIRLFRAGMQLSLEDVGKIGPETRARLRKKHPEAFAELEAAARKHKPNAGRFWRALGRIAWHVVQGAAIGAGFMLVQKYGAPSGGGAEG